jgi:hypothetical protein
VTAVATLHSETFNTRPDGPLGAPWVLTGVDQLTVVGGFVTLAGTDTNGYADLTLNGTPTTIMADWVFLPGTPNPTVCLINHGEDPFSGANMRLHIVITPQALEVQLRVDDEVPFEDLLDPPVYEFETPLPTSGLLGIVVGIDGDTATIVAPDGATLTATDPRLASMPGNHVAIQVIRTAGTDPVGEWYSIDIEGTPAMAAPTHVNPAGTLNDQPGVAAQVHLAAATAVDATNGNTTPNNGLLYLYVSATAADATFTVVRPELPDQAYSIPVGGLDILGPFEVDEFGPDLVWHGLATTSVRPVQLNIP